MSTQICLTPIANYSLSCPVSYQGLNDPAFGSSTFLSGVRGIPNTPDVYISGNVVFEDQSSTGIIYQGPLSMSGCGNIYNMNYPSSAGINVTKTVLYGPNAIDSDNLEFVGNYFSTQTNGTAVGMYYSGPLDGSGSWRTLNPQVLVQETTINTIAHSTNGGVVVGNYDTVLIQGKAFIYTVNDDQYYSLKFPGSLTCTAYGVWYNGNTSYTITGGFNTVGPSAGYLVDWDSSTKEFSHWKAYYSDNQKTTGVMTHFEGITTDGNGGYNLVSGLDNTANSGGGYFVKVGRAESGGFGVAKWIEYAVPGAFLTTADTVFENNVIGLYTQHNSSLYFGYIGAVDEACVASTSYCS